MIYKESVAFSAGCGSGYRDGVRNLEVWCWSLWVEGGGGRYRKTEYFMEVKIYLFKCFLLKISSSAASTFSQQNVWCRCRAFSAEHILPQSLHSSWSSAFACQEITPNF